MPQRELPSRSLAQAEQEWSFHFVCHCTHDSMSLWTGMWRSRVYVRAPLSAEWTWQKGLLLGFKLSIRTGRSRDRYKYCQTDQGLNCGQRMPSGIFFLFHSQPVPPCSMHSFFECLHISSLFFFSPFSHTEACIGPMDYWYPTCNHVPITTLLPVFTHRTEDSNYKCCSQRRYIA